MKPEYSFSKWEAWQSKAALSFFNLESTSPIKNHPSPHVGLQEQHYVGFKWNPPQIFFQRSPKAVFPPPPPLILINSHLSEGFFQDY